MKPATEFPVWFIINIALKNKQFRVISNEHGLRFKFSGRRYSMIQAANYAAIQITERKQSCNRGRLSQLCIRVFQVKFGEGYVRGMGSNCLGIGKSHYTWIPRDPHTGAEIRFNPHRYKSTDDLSPKAVIERKHVNFPYPTQFGRELFIILLPIRYADGFFNIYCPTKRRHYCGKWT